MKIFAIDPSLTSTGLALIDDDTVTVDTRSSTGKRADTVAQRDERIVGLASRITGLSRWAGLNDRVRSRGAEADLIVIEGPTPGTRGGSVWDRAGLWWRIVSSLPTEKVAIVPPKTRAKWATSNGNADKAAVASVASRLCPQVELRNSDEADALILALMGEHALLGDAFAHDTKYRREALLKCQWPADVAAMLIEPYEQLAAVTS